MILTSPSFGNTWANDFKVLQRSTLGNELKVIADAEWPNIQRLQMIFENRSVDAKDALVADILAGYGTEMNLTDFEGKDYVGIITGDVVVTEAKPNCGYSVSFEFEGMET